MSLSHSAAVSHRTTSVYTSYMHNAPILYCVLILLMQTSDCYTIKELHDDVMEKVGNTLQYHFSHGNSLERIGDPVAEIKSSTMAIQVGINCGQLLEVDEHGHGFLTLTAVPEDMAVLRMMPVDDSLETFSYDISTALIGEVLPRNALLLTTNIANRNMSLESEVELKNTSMISLTLLELVSQQSYGKDSMSLGDDSHFLKTSRSCNESITDEECLECLAPRENFTSITYAVQLGSLSLTPAEDGQIIAAPSDIIRHAFVAGELLIDLVDLNATAPEQEAEMKQLSIYHHVENGNWEYVYKRSYAMASQNLVSAQGFATLPIPIVGWAYGLLTIPTCCPAMAVTWTFSWFVPGIWLPLGFTFCCAI